MRKKLWFKRKTYGWGWAPASVEGWIILLLYIFANIRIFLAIDQNSHSGSDTLIGFAPLFLLLTLGLCVVCYLTGEEPRWQWGRDEEL